MAHAPRLSLLALAALLPACGAALREEAPAPAPVEGPALVMAAPRQAVLRPVSAAGARRIWRGEGNVAVATDGARVVATAGLPRVVMGTRLDGPDPLADPRGLVGREVAARRTVDLGGAERDPATMRFGLSLDCTLRGAAEGGWIVVQERCTGDGVAFTNRFLADPATGTVRESEQWAGEEVVLRLRHQGW